MKILLISFIASVAICLTGVPTKTMAQQSDYTQQGNCPQCYWSPQFQAYYSTHNVSNSYDSGQVVYSGAVSSTYPAIATAPDYSSSEIYPSQSYPSQVYPLQTVQEPRSYRSSDYRPRPVVQASYSGNYYASTNPQPGLAQQKAEQAAQMGFRDHVGGGLGGAKFEGVGWSNQSPQSAIQNCCYWGQRPTAQIGVSKGQDGCWYACVLYH